MKPKDGWIAELNAEVIAWAEEHVRWRDDAIRRGVFPAVYVPSPAPQLPVGAAEGGTK